MQERMPKTHIRKVTTGRVGSSVTGTVNATCSTGELSSSGEGVDSELLFLLSSSSTAYITRNFRFGILREREKVRERWFTYAEGLLWAERLELPSAPVGAENGKCRDVLFSSGLQSLWNGRAC